VIPASASAHRRGYLDWLRGVGVLIMIEGHTLDSWTRVEDRGREGYQWAIQLAGLGAPLFLFLAGVAIALAAGSRARRGMSSQDTVRTAVKRGAWIFALAFLFRAQSWIISGGPFPGSLLKVDILNVMGLSMIAAALLWAVAGRPVSRAAVYLGATAVIAMATPIVRGAEILAALPDPIEGYVRPSAGSTTFTLLPWSGFLVAGTAVGCWLDALRPSSREARVVRTLTLLGLATAAVAYGTSFLPSIYEDSSFWTSSPTFFFLRLGLVIASLGLGYVAAALRGGRLMEEFGRASLFVYWIHVEMVYGVVSLPLHRRLPFEGTLVAMALFGVLLFAIVRLKNRFVGPGRLPERRSSDESTLRPAESHVR
jgi:uncharacterized membrane protein